MNGTINAILIHDLDDVATALVDLRPGDIARYIGRGEVVQITVAENIPKFHKFAVRDIRKAERIRKYGEIIGEALNAIAKGNHVH